LPPTLLYALSSSYHYDPRLSAHVEGIDGVTIIPLLVLTRFEGLLLLCQQHVLQQPEVGIEKVY
jgi:hypothetical protein